MLSSSTRLAKQGYFWRKPPARLGELSGNLLPYFGYKRVWEAIGKGSTPWESIFHLKLVRRIRKKEKIKAEVLP